MNNKKQNGKGLYWIATLGACWLVLPVVDNASDSLDCSVPLLIIICAAFFLFATFASVILHEVGHMIFGLLTGYHFVSFRVGSLMIMKDADGRITKKKYSLAGTGGQCLLSPPVLSEEGTIPFVLYMMGGVIMGLILSALNWLLSELCTLPVLKLFFAVNLLMEFVLSISNGVPMNSGGVANDGKNTREMLKNKSAVKALWTQLEINRLQNDGMRLKDMPDELFEIPCEEDMQNSMCAALAVFHCDRLLDMQMFSQYAEFSQKLISGDNGVLAIHKNLLTCGTITAQYILGNREEAERLYTSQILSFTNTMKNSPTVLCCNYAHYLLGRKDSQKADEVLSQFNSLKGNYPYEGALEGAQETINLVRNRK